MSAPEPAPTRSKPVLQFFGAIVLLTLAFAVVALIRDPARGFRRTRGPLVVQAAPEFIGELKPIAERFARRHATPLELISASGVPGQAPHVIITAETNAVLATNVAQHSAAETFTRFFSAERAR
jgi:hypothetical protein